MSLESNGVILSNSFLLSIFWCVTFEDISISFDIFFFRQIFFHSDLGVTSTVSMGWDDHNGLSIFTRRVHESHHSTRGASEWYPKMSCLVWDKICWRWSSLQNTICHSLVSVYNNSHCFCMPDVSTFASRVPKFHLISTCSKFSISSFELGLVSSWEFPQFYQV